MERKYERSPEEMKYKTLKVKLNTVSKYLEEISHNLTYLQHQVIGIKSNQSHEIKKVVISKAQTDVNTYPVQKNEEQNLVFINQNGLININKTILTDYLLNSLKQWNVKNEPLAFMHIGKSGGTSFRGGLLNAKHDLGCRLKGTTDINIWVNYSCPGQIPCVCNSHYDWTVIQKLKSKGMTVKVLTLLRDPIKRMISHFYFSKTLGWTKGKDIRHQNFSDYLNDTASMLDTRDVWQDGQVSIITCVANFFIYSKFCKYVFDV